MFITSRNIKIKEIIFQDIVDMIETKNFKSLTELTTQR